MVLALAALLFQVSSLSQALHQAGLPVGIGSKVAPAMLLAATLPDSGHGEALVSVSSSSAWVRPTDSVPLSNGPGESSSASLNPASLHAALQRSPSLAMIRVPDRESPPLNFVSAAPLPSRRNWIALSIAQHAAAAFDAYTTRQAISRGALEQDPLMRPFANSSALYAAIQAAPVALDFATRHMLRSENNFLRRTWWMPQAASTGMFLLSGAHNIHVQK